MTKRREPQGGKDGSGDFRKLKNERGRIGKGGGPLPKKRKSLPHLS